VGQLQVEIAELPTRLCDQRRLGEGLQELEPRMQGRRALCAPPASCVDVGDPGGDQRFRLDPAIPGLAGDHRGPPQDLQPRFVDAGANRCFARGDQ